MELINGRTAEEIKRGLIACSRYYTSPDEECAGCPYGVKESPVCAINILMQDALALIERLEAAQTRWISGSCPPRERGEVLVIARGKPKENIQLLDAYELAEYVPGEGWIFEAYPEWENGEVRWWMPLPEEPKEGNA